MEPLHFKHWPRSLPRGLTLPRTSLWYNAEVSAARFPDVACLVFYDGVTSFAEFHRQAEQLAGYLQQVCGVKRGDRVAIDLQNSPQFVIAYYAILRADAVVVPLNCMLLGDEVARVIEDAGARVLVVAQDLVPRVESLLGRNIDHAIIACYSDYVGSGATNVPELYAAPAQRFASPAATLWRDALARNLRPAPHQSTDQDLCVMPYTSGTTGRPKGCMHNHRGVMQTVVTLADWWDTRAGSCLLAVVPFFHVTGMQTAMNVGVYTGSTVVVMPRWDREEAAELIRRYRVTGLTAVPAMVVDLVSSPNFDRYDLSSLKKLGGGGAAMPAAVAAKLQELCGLKYCEGYGLSETMAPSHLNPESNPKRQCLGIPTFDVDSRVIDPVTLEEVPQGEVGEIVIHGPQVLVGYWNQPAETEACFVTIDGERFLRSGDLGRVDEDGYFFFVDRLKRMINAAGYKVWPAEVESLLYAHPAIQEAVVIGTRDDRRGEQVKAVVVVKPAARGTVDPESIITWAREHMAAYKVPRVIEFVDALPRSATGKINWRQLQEAEQK